MHRRSRSAPILATAMLALASTAAAAQGDERYTLRGDSVSVHDLVGIVRVVPGSGPDVVVRVARGGADASRLRVETGEVRGHEALRVIFPDDDIVYPRLSPRSRVQLGVRDDGTIGGGFGRGRDHVTIRSSGSGLEAWADLTIEVPAGKSVAVHVGAGELHATNVTADLLLDVAAASVTTERTRGRLVLDTGSGRTSVTNAEGPVFLDSGSGAVTITGVRGPSLIVDSGSGSVRVRDVAVRELELDSGSGSVRTAEIAADVVRVDSGSGSVELDLTSDVRSLDVDSGSGSVTIRIPPSFGAELDVETGSGGIDVGVPVQVTTARRNLLRGRIGDGDGRVRVDGGSGTIRLVQR